MKADEDQPGALASRLDEPVATLTEKHDGGVTEPQAVKLWLRLLTCSITIEKRLRRRLGEGFDTTLPRFDVLAALDRNPDGLTMGQLSQALLVSGGNLTALVRQLEKNGFLEMSKAPSDGRSWIVRINARGKRHFAKLAEAHHHWIGEMFAGMSADQSRRLYGLLAELKTSLVQVGDD